MRSHRGEQRVSNIPELQRGRKLRRVAVLRGLSLRCLYSECPYLDKVIWHASFGDPENRQSHDHQQLPGTKHRRPEHRTVQHRRTHCIEGDAPPTAPHGRLDRHTGEPPPSVRPSRNHGMITSKTTYMTTVAYKVSLTLIASTEPNSKVRSSI